jgi:glycosyltransferase involved in cell wall biosynthesis
MAELPKPQSISISLHQSPHPLLSIIITSYTTERLGDIYELLDSIKAQTLIETHGDSTETRRDLMEINRDLKKGKPANLNESPNPNKSQPISPLETIFVAERSRELYERVKEYGEEIFGDSLETGRDSVEIRDSVETGRDSVEIKSPNLNQSQPISTNLPFKVLFNDGEPGLSAARNLGIRKAKGDIIAFVDDDVVLPPDWAEEMINAYQDDSIIGVTGPALPLWEDESMSWLPEELYWIISCTAWCGWNQTREVRNAWGMNMSFKTEAFQKCGDFSNKFGYHKGPMAEDNEFSLIVKAKTGKRIIYHPNVRLWHRVHKYRLSQRFIKERAYWIGHSRRMLKRLYPEAEKGKDLLDQEHQLLKRIFTRLFPSILKDFFTNPVIAWRKLSVTITALFFVTLGYHSHLLNPFNRQKIKLGGNR